MEQRALLSGGPSRVFVDAHAVGTPDGTKQHPYPTIEQGVNAASPGGTVYDHKLTEVPTFSTEQD
jgi:hypothetical protein